MDSLDRDYASGLLANPEPPCLSLYQPTHRSNPDKLQGPIRFRNLVKQLEESLRQQYASRDARPLLQPFWDLADDTDFWNYTYDGLAVLGAPGFFRVYRLQRSVAELAVVAESFHVKPLLRIVQSADRYQVLALSLHRAQLYEGNRDVLDPVEIPADAQERLDAALESPDRESRTEVWNHGGGATGVRHRHASGSSPTEREAERFFRTVDQVVLERFSRPSGLPLLLVALPEHHTPFRRISHNPLLMAEGIEINPDSLSIDELRKRAWKVVEPQYLARLAGLIDMFGAAWPRDLATDDLAQAMRGAVAGRVSTLLLEAERQIPGRSDPATGAITFGELSDPDVDDLLDDLAERTMQTGGQVVIVPAERMPTRSGLAAIYRF